MSQRISVALALVMLFGVAAAADAQMPLPVHFSVNAGTAIPIGNEADVFDSGVHVGANLKIALIPLQIEAAYDRMGNNGKTANTDDLSILSAGLALPMNITPGLLPVGVYAIAGGGLYRHNALVTATDFGVSGGAGVRIGIPGIALYVEGRGVIVLADANRLTYLTAAVGVRF